jgi:two-component system LytT family response regulator
MKVRAIIVDDEAPARELIATLARQETDFEVVSECASGTAALKALRELQPDLLFLDIQLPGFDGFELLARLPAGQWPLVIFVTAFHQHAIRAFEMHALDYLLKPFEYDRLREAIARARQMLKDRDTAAQQGRIARLLEDWQNQNSRWERFAVREAGRIVFLRYEEVDWIEAEGNYLRLHVGKATHLLRETLGALETRLAAKKFLRVNRSALVNLEKVREWQPMFNGDSVLILEGGMRLPVSRFYRGNFDRAVTALDASI